MRGTVIRGFKVSRRGYVVTTLVGLIPKVTVFLYVADETSLLTSVSYDGRC